MKADVEQALILTITEKLAEVTVDNDLFIDRQQLNWVSELAAKLDSGFRGKLSRYCGAQGLKEFLHAELTRRLQAKYSYKSESKKVSITSYPEFKNLLSIARETVDRLKRIPFSYRVTLGLPKTFSIPILPYITPTSFDTERATIFLPGNLPDPFPLETGNPHLDSALFSDWLDQSKVEEGISEERLYFSIVADGYSGGEGAKILSRQLEDDLRAFYGSAQALHIIGNYYRISEGSEKPQVIIHREEQGRPIIYTSEMEDELWSPKYKLSTFFWIDGCKSADRQQEINNKFSLISRIYDDDLFHRRLYTACIWFYRANVSARPLDALLESTIAMEVILGDEKESEGLGLTKLLRNRCAYMLGQNQAEREAILQTFTDLYRLRSAIVHSGRHRADEGERAVVTQALRLCGRIIAHELRGASFRSEA